MNAGTKILLVLILAPVAALATPTEFNGHFYEVVVYPKTGHPDKTWPTAKLAAEAAEFTAPNGMTVNGHLATITSSAEDNFLEGLRAGTPGLHKPEVWVGGFQDLPCAPGTAPDCNWTWVNGEGQFVYTNWQGGEPNDSGGEEQYLGIGLGGQPGWNDERRLRNIGGYIIEYDVPIAAAECVAGDDGCPIIRRGSLQRW